MNAWMFGCLGVWMVRWLDDCLFPVGLWVFIHHQHLQSQQELQMGRCSLVERVVDGSRPGRRSRPKIPAPPPHIQRSKMGVSTLLTAGDDGQKWVSGKTVELTFPFAPFWRRCSTQRRAGLSPLPCIWRAGNPAWPGRLRPQ